MWLLGTELRISGRTTLTEPSLQPPHGDSPPPPFLKLLLSIKSSGAEVLGSFD